MADCSPGALSPSGCITILVATLGRAHALEAVLASVEAATSYPHFVLFIADAKDEDTCSEVEWLGADLLVYDGTYPEKINAGARHTTTPYVLAGADDLRFHDGWLEAALEHFTHGIGVVGTNDLHSRRVMRGEFATHPILSRDYINRGTIDEPGKVFHEGYRHNCIDVELAETAKYRGAWAFARDSHVEHLHPNHGNAERDATYALQDPHLKADQALLRKRRALWT